MIAELKARIAEMRTIIDTATDGVVLIGRDGTIRSISRPAEALFGFDSDEVAGKPFASLFAIESQRAARDYLNGLSDHGVASVLNDGREVIGREAQGPLHPAVHDHRQAAQRQRLLRRGARHHAVEARRGGTDPGARGGRARLLAEDRFPRPRQPRDPHAAQRHHRLFRADGGREVRRRSANDRYRDYLRDINRSGNHVLDLVNDLLDISKIEAGQQEMDYEAVSLNDTLAETVAMMQPQANRERVIIRSSFASRLPEVVADLRSVRQIALNILSNAIRYTQAGGQVIVSTAYETSGDVVMRVRDTGIGMSQAEIEQALKPFKQINALKRGARRRHRARPAADQGDGRGQPRALHDQLDAGRRHAGRGRLPVDAGAGRMRAGHSRTRNPGQRKGARTGRLKGIDCCHNGGLSESDPQGTRNGISPSSYVRLSTPGLNNSLPGRPKNLRKCTTREI